MINISQQHWTVEKDKSGILSNFYYTCKALIYDHTCTVSMDVLVSTGGRGFVCLWRKYHRRRMI